MSTGRLMKAENFGDDVRQHCYFQLWKQASDKQKVVIENIEANLTQRVRNGHVKIRTIC